jgi:serine/threonine protein kinase
MEKLLREFDQRWRHEAPARLDDFVARISVETVAESQRRELLVELIMIDLQYRWRLAGQARTAPLGTIHECPCLESYVERYPELGRPGPLAVELIAEEYWVRHVWGDRPGHAEYLQRFATLHADLSAALARMDAELAEELTQGAPPRGTSQQPAAAPTTTASLIDTLREHGLLSAAQFAALASEPLRRSVAPRMLARELLQRGWLTAYQVNQLLLGRGADLVLGPYLLLERLGEGGAGQVFKARHQNMNRVVAVKLLRKELLADAQVVARFYREIQIVSQLDHANVVHAYDAGPAGAGHFLAMEYIEGTDLGKLVKQGGPLPVQQACAYIRHAALGLQHAHERGLVHRDIKPHNLIVSLKEGLVKVADLGLARLPRPINEECTAALSGVRTTGTLTPENAMMLGTTDYMAPEQALDFHRADIRSDIYSLGCSFYYLLAGQPPFAGGTLAQKLLKHQQSEPPGLVTFRNDVPGDVVAVLRKLLAKQPQDRYQTPGQVAEALAGSARSGPLRLSPPLPPTRRRRWLVAAVIGGCLALAVYGSICFLASPRQDANVKGSAPLAGTTRGPGSAFGQLDPQTIPAELRAALPKEVVAVLGAPGKKMEAGALAVSPDGQWLAWVEKTWPKKGELAYFIHLWQVAGWREADGFPRLASKPGGYPAPPVFQLAFSPDNKILALATVGKVELWDLGFPHPKPPRTLKHDQGDELRALAFTEDVKTLATGGLRAIKLWNLETHSEQEAIPQNKGVWSLAISPDGKTLAAAYYDSSVKVWAIDGQPALLHTLDNANRPVKFSESWLLTNGKTNSVCLWNLAGTSPAHTDFKLPADLSGGNDEFARLAIVPTGQLVAAARNGSLVVWDTARQTELYHLSLVSKVKAVAFAPDGRHLITSNEDGHVYIFRLAEVHR